MNIQKEKLIAEIENFKTEILKIQVVKVWAESHSNSDPFKQVILEKEDCKVWWMEAQAHQLWETWLAAKAQAVPEGFVLVLREPTEEMLGTAWEAPPAGGPSDNRRTFYERQAVVYKAMVEEAEKEMIEVQEQGHD
ncbi:hypothetical protein [Acinetobacter entericus]|uniref:Uncharacterized protein n=1 Tax=Acinetobacter entericus TaxID=2989714 RepID=A0ABT3NLS2_9GAMM|nr:hypothetical protein [Acinetobacter entericus]MCW8040522.1 hypothetical protein [Acinetobacter entericus]